MTEATAPDAAVLQYTIEAHPMHFTDGGRVAGFTVFCCKDGSLRHAALCHGNGEYHTVNHITFATAEQALAAYENGGELTDPAHPQQRKYRKA